MELTSSAEEQEGITKAQELGGEVTVRGFAAEASQVSISLLGILHVHLKFESDCGRL